MADDPEPPAETPQLVVGKPRHPLLARAVAALVWAERGVFFAIGALLFMGALALLKDSLSPLFGMLAGAGSGATGFGSRFLDIILLVLIFVELAYTVVLSLRGAVLLAEPFLIVGLIAVIRRMLVITAGDATGKSGSVMQSASELAVLTGIVIVFVFAIFLLRSKPKRGFEIDNEDVLSD